MTKSIRKTILDSRHYKSGEFFQAVDIQGVIAASGRKVALNSIQQDMVDLKLDGLLGIEKRKHGDGLARYYRTDPPPEMQPLRMPWRTRDDIPSHSPVWC